MSEQQEAKQQKDDPNAAEAAKLDATAAAAALAHAVKSAEQASGKARRTGGKAMAAVQAALSPAAWWDVGRAAAAAALAIGLGAAAGLSGSSGGTSAPVKGEAAAATESNQRHHDNLAGLTRDVRALAASLETMRKQVEQARSHGADQTKSIAALTERLERIERAGAETGAKLAAMGARLDSLERQGAAPAAAKAAINSDGPPTGSVPDTKAAKAQPTEGWVVHDVYRGTALVESRNGRMYEAAVGQRLPVLGVVEAVARRGQNWVVITPKGTISGKPGRKRFTVQARSERRGFLSY
jgi:hypothetical protein